MWTDSKAPGLNANIFVLFDILLHRDTCFEKKECIIAKRKKKDKGEN